MYKTEFMCKDLGWRNSRESKCKGPVAGTGFMSPWSEGLEVGRQGGCFGEAKQKQSFFFMVGSLLPGERKVVLLPQDSTKPSLGGPCYSLSLPEASSVMSPFICPVKPQYLSPMATVGHQPTSLHVHPNLTSGFLMPQSDPEHVCLNLSLKSQTPHLPFTRQGLRPVVTLQQGPPHLGAHSVWTDIRQAPRAEAGMASSVVPEPAPGTARDSEGQLGIARGSEGDSEGQ